METLTDSNANEQNDVFPTLSEQQISSSDLVRRVLSQVQTEFTMWNASHCHQAFTSFAPSSTWRSCLHPNLRSPTLASMTTTSNSSPSPVASEANSPLPLVSQEVYSPDGAVVEISSVKLEVIHLSSSAEPHPPYESCSPLHRSVFKGDDSDNMAFIPYADDHTFDQISHTRHYGSFSWQDAFDPDLEVIVLEAVYRLQIHYALSYDEIEGCNVLPLKLRSRPGIHGVLSTDRRRDRLHWTGNTIPTSYSFPPIAWSEGCDFRNRLKTLNSFFCPNLSCVEPLCNAHVEPNPMPLESQPHVFGEVTSPCRNQCFINNKIEEASPSWGEVDLDIFRAISEISPNTTPCDLAELCLKPCYEVFYYGKLLYSCNTDEAQPANIKSQQRILRFNGTYRHCIGSYDSYLSFQTSIQHSLHRMSWAIFLHPRLHHSLASETTLAAILALVAVPPVVHVSKTNRIVNATAIALQNVSRCLHRLRHGPTLYRQSQMARLSLLRG
ncbi:hypothetical protein J3R82DRAFT_10451 [Butyriboletus roseoflavus]|nr:hypothetical protein J3R82DRAFT_10451 [Butyriboletus roseoflavus]